MRNWIYFAVFLVFILSACAGGEVGFLPTEDSGLQGDSLVGKVGNDALTQDPVEPEATQGILTPTETDFSGSIDSARKKFAEEETGNAIPRIFPKPDLTLADTSKFRIAVANNGPNLIDKQLLPSVTLANPISSNLTTALRALSRDAQHQAYAVIANQDAQTVKREWDARANPETGEIDPQKFLEFLLTTDRNLLPAITEMKVRADQIRQIFELAGELKDYTWIDSVILAQLPQLIRYSNVVVRQRILSTAKIYELEGSMIVDADAGKISGAGEGYYGQIYQNLADLFTGDVDPIHTSEALQNFHREMRLRNEKLKVLFTDLLRQTSFQIQSFPGSNSYSDISFLNFATGEYGNLSTDSVRFYR